jgi:hypothetical protein
MNEARARGYLEVITNVAVLCVALLVLGTAGWRYLSPKTNARSDGGLRRGERLPEILGVDYRTASKTMVIALSSKCSFCGDSIPFFNELAEKGGGSIRITAVFPESQGEVEEYVRQKQLRFPAIAGIDLARLHLEATPISVLVDSGGKVLDFWVGKPSGEVGQRMIKALTG